jgi:hypothetical protein
LDGCFCSHGNPPTLRLDDIQESEILANKDYRRYKPAKY